MKKIIYNNNLIARGLSIALLLGLLISISNIRSYAATGNELREYLGLNVVTSIDAEAYKDFDFSPSNNEETYINNAKTAEDNKGTNTSINIGEATTSSIDYAAELSNKQNELVIIKGDIQNLIDTGSTAIIIIKSIDNYLVELKTYNDLLENSGKSTGYANDYMIRSNSTEHNDGSTDKERVDTVYELEELETGHKTITHIASLDFTIGAIGEQAISIVQSQKKLVTPYGFTKSIFEDNYNGKKLLGIDLYTIPDYNILSQWNGIVTDISYDDTGKLQCIKIMNGPGIYTYYSHVYANKDITVGVSVIQGQVIAKAADTTLYEPDKDNHVFYQIQIDGVFINPILIYGNSGKSMYEDWILSYPLDNQVEEGEKYYNNVEIDIYKIPEQTVRDVVYPDFNK